MASHRILKISKNTILASGLIRNDFTKFAMIGVQTSYSKFLDAVNQIICLPEIYKFINIDLQVYFYLQGMCSLPDICNNNKVNHKPTDSKVRNAK